MCMRLITQFQPLHCLNFNRLRSSGLSFIFEGTQKNAESQKLQRKVWSMRESQLSCLQSIDRENSAIRPSAFHHSRSVFFRDFIESIIQILRTTLCSISPNWQFSVSKDLHEPARNIIWVQWFINSQFFISIFRRKTSFIYLFIYNINKKKAW